MFSWYVAHVFSKWLWNSPSRPLLLLVSPLFYIPHALYFYCKVFIIFIIIVALWILLTDCFVNADPTYFKGDRCSSVVKVLCYTPEGGWFDPSWCQLIFHWHNPSDRTVVLVSTQPLTEMSKRSISWGWKRPVLKADNLTTVLGHCHVIWER